MLKYKNMLYYIIHILIHFRKMISIADKISFESR